MVKRKKREFSGYETGGRSNTRRREGSKEGRKDGRKEGRMEGWKGEGRVLYHYENPRVLFFEGVKERRREGEKARRREGGHHI